MDEANPPEITAKICEIISESTDYQVSELSTRASEHLHKEMGIDSLTLLEVALTIDQEFDTDFTEEELLGMESVNRATELVIERLKSKKTAA